MRLRQYRILSQLVSKLGHVRHTLCQHLSYVGIHITWHAIQNILDGESSYLCFDVENPAPSFDEFAERHPRTISHKFRPGRFLEQGPYKGSCIFIRGYQGERRVGVKLIDKIVRAVRFLQSGLANIG